MAVQQAHRTLPRFIIKRRHWNRVTLVVLALPFTILREVDYDTAMQRVVRTGKTCADIAAARSASWQGPARLSALRVLRSFGGTRALEEVRKAAADPALREEALRMICDWPTPEALPDVQELAKESPELKLKILALRACLRLIPLQDTTAARKLAALKEAISLVERPEERKLALAALAETPNPGAARIIESSLADPAVKAEAETALVRAGRLLADTHPQEAKALLDRFLASSAGANLKREARVIIKRMEEGWRDIFNGKDFTGWDGEPGWLRVEEGSITAESTQEKPCKRCTYLFWKDGAPADFELRADFRLSPEANSGIQIRSERRPTWDAFGYQADMSGDGRLAGFVYHHKRGLIADRGRDVTISPEGKKDERVIGDPDELLAVFRKGEWNNYRIVCRGPKIELYVNGELMCRFTDLDKSGSASSGVIALQMHPGPPMKVQFRNIRLRELGR